MRWVRFLLAVSALPFCFALGRTLKHALFSAATAPACVHLSPDGWGFVAGFALFLVLFLVAPAPLRSYVWAHELTHALWGLAFGARVSKIRIGQSGGSVTLSKSNVWITLAPYFFPFYAMLVALAACIVRFFASPLPLSWLWFFAWGFTGCYHICLTLCALSQRQRDILVYGRLFSWVFIWIMHVIGLLIVLAWLGDIPFAEIARHLARTTLEAYRFAAGGVAALFRFLYAHYGQAS